MARIRTIKPEFFTSEDIVDLEPLTRLLYIALWCEADKEGRLVWKPKTFKIRYFPADNCDIESMCDALVTRGLVTLYGEGLAFIGSFKDHQHINPRESESKLPAPDDASITRQSRDSDATVTHREEGKGKEGIQNASGRVKRKTSIPDDFSISDRVKAWAEKNGHQNLQKHFDNFVSVAKAKGYQYVDWDSAFETAIRSNWAKVESTPEQPNPDELITLPDGRQVTRAMQDFMRRMVA